MVYWLQVLAACQVLVLRFQRQFKEILQALAQSALEHGMAALSLLVMVVQAQQH